MKILILGVNGFIGNSLTAQILRDTDWEIYGMDIKCDKLDMCLGHDRFHFVEGDISINKEWIEYNVKKCDVIMPSRGNRNTCNLCERALKGFRARFRAKPECGEALRKI